MKFPRISRPALVLLALGAQIAHAKAAGPLDDAYIVSSVANLDSYKNDYTLQKPGGPKISVIYNSDATSVAVEFNDLHTGFCKFDGPDKAIKQTTTFTLLYQVKGAQIYSMGGSGKTEIPRELLQAVVSGMDRFTGNGSKTIGLDGVVVKMPSELSRAVDELMDGTGRCDIPPQVSLRTPSIQYSSVAVKFGKYGLGPA